MEGEGIEDGLLYLGGRGIGCEAEDVVVVLGVGVIVEVGGGGEEMVAWSSSLLLM